LWEALAEGALCLAATAGLAQALRFEYALRKRGEGAGSWPAPAIHTWEDWLRRQAAEVSLSPPEGWPVWLSARQEERVWAQVIRASPQAESLLSIGAAARQARSAYAFLQAWRIDARGLDATEDGAAFAGWLREFDRLCARNGWRSLSRLAGAFPLALPGRVLLAGFTRLTPVQRSLLASAERWGPGPPAPQCRLAGYPSAQDEYLAAARWAREWIESRPGARVAIVSPDLTRIRRPLGAVLRGELAAAHSPLESASLPYHFSSGVPLAQTPIVHQALRLLEGAAAGRKPPSRWARDFAEFLLGSGWPREDRTGAEQQAVDAWRDALSSLASLDVVTGPLSREEARRLIQEIVAETMFQVEDQGQPIQVLSVPESLGRHFDAVWLLGFDAKAWPPRAEPHALIPYALQREACDPARAIQEARLASRYLLALGADVTVSFSRADGEERLQPSPLFAGLKAEPRFAPAATRMAAPVEAIADRAPAFTGDSVPGGAGLFKHQAECPFRAFAIERLGLKEEPEEVSGLDPAQRGTLLHAALSQAWRELRDSDGLSRAALESVAGRAVENAMRERPLPAPAAYREIERERLTRLVILWLELERQRKVPFRVIANEERRAIEVNGLKTSIQVDRIDELEDGRLVLIDYKSGRVKKAGWKGERPSEPQVPLYAVTQSGEIAAVALAQVRRGECKFVGEAAEKGLIPGAASGRTALSEWIAQWRAALETLAEEFRSGEAAPRPLNAKVCETCHLPALCRIHETGVDDEGEDDDAE
jgi:RecB family exonuclease